MKEPVDSSQQWSEQVGVHTSTGLPPAMMAIIPVNEPDSVSIDLQWLELQPCDAVSIFTVCLGLWSQHSLPLCWYA
jgi:hypothetical protein